MNIKFLLFLTLNTIALNTSAMHKRKPEYPCEVCDLPFGRKEHLKRHKVRHYNECLICKQNSISRELLEEHYCSVHKLCNHCAKSHESIEELKKHLSECQKNKSGECQLCGKSFNNLRSHVNTHLGLEKFPCTKCGRLFKVHGQMTRHLEKCEQDTPKVRAFERSNAARAAAAIAIARQANDYQIDDPLAILSDAAAVVLTEEQNV